MSVGGHVFVARNVSGIPASSPWSVSVVNPQPVSETFDSVSPVILVQGQSVEAPAMTITFLSGSGQVAIHDIEWSDSWAPTPGQIDGHVLHLGRSGQNPTARVTRLELKGECSSVSYYHFHSSVGKNYATYYNRSGVLLGTQYLENSFVGPKLHLFSASGIARIEVHVAKAEWVMLDHFTFS